MADGWEDPAPYDPYTTGDPNNAGHAGYPGQPGYPGYGGYPAPASIPTFVKVVVIIDLVFCCIRLLIVPLSLLGMTTIDPADPLYPTVIFEVLTGLGIALFGIAGHTMILLRKEVGIYLVGLAILSTFGSMAVGLWQMPYALAEFDPGTPERTGAYIGVAVVLLIRLGLCALVGVALVKFKSWCDTQRV